MILETLPDVKIFHKLLTVGQDYDIICTIGNSVVIQTSNPDLCVIILASRFKTDSL